VTDLELCFTPATELAAQIRAGTLSPVTLIENTLDRIASVNPTLNCFCFVYPDEAMASAQQFVGSVIIIVNQGDLILDGHISPRTWLKIGVTPLVPFCVSLYGAYLAYRNALASQPPT
jgi:hypothetical protein